VREDGADDVASSAAAADPDGIPDFLRRGEAVA